MEEAFRELDAAASGWGLPLSEDQQRRIQAYLDFLLEYNLKTNLTAETDFRTLLLRHVADGLFAAAVLRTILAGPQPRLADLGSGGGFIGMTVKIAWPEADVTLIESSRRKYEFLNLAALRCGLRGLHVARAGAKPFDAVVERALAPLPEALRLALELASPGGWVLAYQSEAPNLDDVSLKKVLGEKSSRWVRNEAYRLPLEDRDRHLALFRRL